MKPYTVLTNVLEPQTLKLLETTLRLQSDLRYVRHGIDPNDTNAFADGHPVTASASGMNSPLITESLFTLLTPRIRQEVGFDITPTFSYCRIYWQGAEMTRHVDRPSCEISISLCITIDQDPWPIYFDGDELLLYPGDLVLYRGCEVPHWRLPYQGREQIQVFMHWVKTGGDLDMYAFDNRPMLGWGTWQSF